MTHAGTVSVFGSKTPVPYPFGLERTGYLVNDVAEANPRSQGSGLRIGLSRSLQYTMAGDAIIQWPGGVNTQLYGTQPRQLMRRCQNIPEIGF